MATIACSPRRDPDNRRRTLITQKHFHRRVKTRKIKQTFASSPDTNFELSPAKPQHHILTPLSPFFVRRSFLHIDHLLTSGNQDINTIMLSSKTPSSPKMIVGRRARSQSGTTVKTSASGTTDESVLSKATTKKKAVVIEKIHRLSLGSSSSGEHSTAGGLGAIIHKVPKRMGWVKAAIRTYIPFRLFRCPSSRREYHLAGTVVGKALCHFTAGFAGEGAFSSFQIVFGVESQTEITIPEREYLARHQRHHANSFP